MGLNYSYNLFFKQDQWGDVIRSVAEYASSCSDFPYQTELELPSGERLDVPFKQDEPSNLSFTVALKFKKDEVLDKVFKREELENWIGSYVYHEHIAIGLWLSIWHDSVLDPRWVHFRFAAPGNGTSLLLWECPTVQDLFANIVKKYQGVCGYLDTEQKEKLVFWLEGKELDPPVQMPEERLSEWLKTINL